MTLASNDERTWLDAGEWLHEKKFKFILNFVNLESVIKERQSWGGENCGKKLNAFWRDQTTKIINGCIRFSKCVRYLL